MRKYGRSGWFNDSHRHYLASKGISTKHKYFMPVRTGGEMRLQKHSGSKKFVDMFNENTFEKGRNKGSKPEMGVLWTSSIRDDIDGGKTDWEEFVDSEQFDKPIKDSFVVAPEDDAKILSIESEDDLQFLQENYASSGPEDFVVIDWDAVSKDYDAVHVSEEAARELKLAGVANNSATLDGWDVESTAWFRKKFKVYEDEDA